MEYVIGYTIGLIISGLIFGFATKVVIKNKGYDDNWFWWGFFFGFIALIVACAKPQNVRYSYSPAHGTALAAAARESHEKKILAAGGWRCACGSVNAAYVSSCHCGRSKSDVATTQHKKELKAEKQDEHAKLADTQADRADELDKAAAIKEYKKLMDDGIISQDEFDSKKKQLLGL
ncbi:MAG TPA: hypothetical protein DFH97_00430 [Clostridiales bacterium]|nr:hypothetical protein [Clostridiales bacterium]